MRSFRGMFRAFRMHRGGGVAVIAAVSALVLVGFTAAAVDFGSVFMKTRQLQGMADLAAMAAAENLDRAQVAAEQTVAANAWSAPVKTTVETGAYAADPAVPPANRFSAGGGAPNAARVTLASSADLYFAAALLGKSSIPISRTATAAQGNFASFSLGTRLAGLNGGMANAVLSALTGSSVNLSVMDYNSLANAQIDLFQYIAALKTRAGIQAGSFDDTLNASVKTSDAIAAIADVLTSQGNGSAAALATELANAADSTPVTLGQLFDLGPYGGQDYVNLSGGSGAVVSALDVATAVLQLAQGGRQVQFDLNLGIPGVSSATAWLAIGQRPANSPWIAITDRNTVVVRTAQARLYIDVKVAPAVALPGVSLIDVPIVVELASAQAKLSDITCGSTSDENSVTLAVAPSVGEAAIGAIDTGQLDDFEEDLAISPATLINALLLQVTGSSQVNLGGEDWQNVSFDEQDILGGVEKTVRTDDIAGTTFSSLLGNLTLNVRILGLNLGLDQGQVTSIVQSTLSGVAMPLDGTVDGLTSLLGLGLGEADARVNGVRCNLPALVQ